MGKDHRAAQTRHARFRATQRYGLDMSRHKLAELVRRIQAGDVISAERQSHSRTWVTMEVDGQVVRLVYHRRTKQIATFLPRQEGVDVE